MGFGSGEERRGEGEGRRRRVVGGDGDAGRERGPVAGAAGLGLLAHVRRVPEHARRGRYQGLRLHEHGRAAAQHLDGRGVQRHGHGRSDHGARRIRGRARTRAAAAADRGAHPAPGLLHAVPHAQPEDGRRGLARDRGLHRRGGRAACRGSRSHSRARARTAAGPGAGAGAGPAAADAGVHDSGGVPGTRRRGSGGHGAADPRAAAARAGAFLPGQCGRAADHAAGERDGGRRRRAGARRRDDGGGADDAGRAQRDGEGGGGGSVVAVAGAVSLRHRAEGEEGADRREGGGEEAEAHDQEQGVGRQVACEEAGGAFFLSVHCYAVR